MDDLELKWNHCKSPVVFSLWNSKDLQWRVSARNHAMTTALIERNHTKMKDLLKLSNLKPLQYTFPSRALLPRVVIVATYLRWLVEQIEHTVNVPEVEGCAPLTQPVPNEQDLVDKFLKQWACVKDPMLSDFLLHGMPQGLIPCRKPFTIITKCDADAEEQNWIAWLYQTDCKLCNTKHDARRAPSVSIRDAADPQGQFPYHLTPEHLAVREPCKMKHDLMEMNADAEDLNNNIIEWLYRHIHQVYKDFLCFSFKDSINVAHGISVNCQEWQVIYKIAERLLETEDTLDYKALGSFCSFMFIYSYECRPIGYKCCTLGQYLSNKIPVCNIEFYQNRLSEVNGGGTFLFNTLPFNSSLVDFLTLSENFLDRFFQHPHAKGCSGTRIIIEMLFRNLCDVSYKMYSRPENQYLLYNEDTFEISVKGIRRIFTLYQRHGYKYHKPSTLLPLLFFKPRVYVDFVELSLTLHDQASVLSIMSELIVETTDRYEVQCTLRDLSAKLMTLESLSRRRILNALGKSPFQKVAELPLPKSLIRYLESFCS